MGNSVSYNETILGKSILNKVYRTKTDIGFKKSIRDNKYYITKWENKQTTINPEQNEMTINLDPGLLFIIRDINYNWGIDSGEHIHIDVQILNDVPIRSNSKVAEATHLTEYENDIFAHWSYVTVENAISPELTKLLSDDGTMLKTKGLKAGLYVFQFNDGTNELDKNRPFGLKKEIFDEISHTDQLENIIDNEIINQPINDSNRDIDLTTQKMSESIIKTCYLSIFCIIFLICVIIIFSIK